MAAAALLGGASALKPNPRLASSTDYYASIDLSQPLKPQLHTLINPHVVYTYDDVWAAFADVDRNLPGYPCNLNNASYIPDIYSSYCWRPDQNVPGGECGNYKKEGDCYNREHIWPKSWWGGFDYGANAQTDLFELWPSDGYVNGLRGDLPLGMVDPNHVTYKSTNGCMVGSCLSTSGSCFEVTDKLKGDVARSYFYISTAYMDEWNCCDTPGTSKSDIKPWMESVLRQWHAFDPVDDNERARNDDIYNNWQHNRNPFIDYPEWVDLIPDF